MVPAPSLLEVDAKDAIHFNLQPVTQELKHLQVADPSAFMLEQLHQRSIKPRHLIILG